MERTQSFDDSGTTEVLSPHYETSESDRKRATQALRGLLEDAGRHWASVSSNELAR